jgi:hypothetical protein|tara:strand:- start:407 stop:1030 length:624 start_codon:yes stop_codon:yes gene_type:complete
MPMKKLLIVTGPQGSGNHLFARLFSAHPNVVGWESLHDKYWVPSDQEPFARYWVYPEELKFPEGDFFCANVSVPFFYDGVRQVPKIKEVAQKAMSLGVQPIIAVIVRDRNINELQQVRVGGECTMDTALEYYKDMAVHFIDHEAFFLYKEKYIEYLGRLLEFPVTKEGIDNFISVDANHKYVFPCKKHWLDDVIRSGRQPFKRRPKE